ncbi:FAD-dependent oxidoreductase [Stratiformator vulcanicus]|uniref:FAD dependent oxidoreductase n=1 Tax=Stratiformator vulcanicus TaxID=2527980 RepID=A0A517R7Q6_9PLAN|nr:FAD-dependent oxidoreductase [Stratiformator vulcanicus]QDT39892.1 FAD dependent oxidoreductase [Stratiformator vulcanicus]
MHLDAVIFGGGAAGLWTLDRLCAGGHRAILLESNALGAGQTVASQGIIHGGLKYTLTGLLTRSAENIRDMPDLWRECLAGERVPNLSGTVVRSDSCYLWRTESLTGRVGMIGARMGLRVTPKMLAPGELPSVLQSCQGPVARLSEQVISPVSFLEKLRERNLPRLFKIDPESGLSLSVDDGGRVTQIGLTDSETGRTFECVPKSVILAAGNGNARLLSQVGKSATVMQRRPLHMVMAKGDLPEFNGHCVDGTVTRVTITSERIDEQTVVWQIGGQIAEDGVGLSEPDLIARARRELAAALPDLSQDGIEWATYRVDRAEGETPQNRRPDDIQVMADGNTLTCWPTKLALVPAMARRIAQLLPHPENSGSGESQQLPEWTRPEVAAPPWETCHWYSDRITRAA